MAETLQISWGQLSAYAKKALASSTSRDHVVGAAILDEHGTISIGANHPVDNHRSTLHAEDSAMSAMFASGGREVRALVVVAFDYQADGSRGDIYYTYPCGSCRNLVADYTPYGTSNEARILWDGQIRTISWAYPRGNEKTLAP